MLDRLYALETFGIKLGLDNITRLCTKLDHPERSFTAVHIAGTNGKGSVTAMVHQALVAAGIPAARYTSPHLVDLRERFVIGTSPVDPETLDAALHRLFAVIDRLVADGSLPHLPTFFEATTALAFDLFRATGVQVAVIEVGLGGRFDATNVIEAPVGAITTIGLDHQQQLGHTLEAIAFEKAGIIKPGMRVVIGRLAAGPRDVISRVALDRHAHLISIDDTPVTSDLIDGQAHVTFETRHHRYGPLTLGLRGTHQVDNALVAVHVLEGLQAAGVAIPEHAIACGLRDVSWPGRLDRCPVREGRALLLDAAHNPEGAEALAAYLDDTLDERPPLVLGVMRDKDAEGILRALLPSVSSVVVTAAHTPRACEPETLAALVRALAPDRHVELEPDVQTAVTRAFALGPTVCVAGSIVLIGEVRDALDRRAILP